MGNEAARALGMPASVFPLTDDEILFRDLAYPLINPPYDRLRWNLYLDGFYRTGAMPYVVVAGNRSAYAARLMTTPYRSATARYARLIDDVRDDVVRIAPYLDATRRVVDFDRKREASLGHVFVIAVEEVADASRRIAENAMILGWVQHCLGERAASFRFALERLVITTPSPAAVEAERLLIDLEARIASLYSGPGPIAGPVPAPAR